MTSRMASLAHSRTRSLAHSPPHSERCCRRTAAAPAQVEGLDGVQIVDVQCGERCTTALDEAGNVFTWGWGGSFMSGAGALGHGDTSTVETPALVEHLEDHGIAVGTISTGEQHCIALSTEGQVLIWGCGEYGRMGDGGSSDNTSPEIMDFFEVGGCESNPPPPPPPHTHTLGVSTLRVC